MRELQVVGSTVHLCPPGDSGTMPCCGLTPFEASPNDRITLDPNLVTCEGDSANG